MRKNLMLVLVLSFVAAAGIVGLAEKEPLLIYTSCPTEIMSAIEQDFEALNPTIDLQVYRSGTGTVQAKIAAEKEAGRILADLIWVAEYSYCETLKDQDLLFPYLSPQAASLPASLVQPEGYYYGARVFAMVICYNSLYVTEPPTSWRDLLDPKWAGQVVTGNPQYSGSNVVTCAALGMMYGVDYFEQLRANGCTVVQGNSQSAAEVSSGAYLIGFTLDNMVRDLKKAGSPIELVYPTDGAVLVPSPIAIIKTTDHLAAAKAFVDYVLSPNGQQALVTFGQYVPARTDVVGPVGAPTLAELSAQSIDLPMGFFKCTSEFFTEQFVEIMLE